jgi:hypothetical protein
VYVPENPRKEVEERILAVDCRYESAPGNPMLACVNTINRAELAAIQVAIEVGIKNCEEAGVKEIHIATDNLASMF